MAEAEPDDGERDSPSSTESLPGLLAWTVAAFHTAVLVAVAVTLLHLRGVAGDVLASLDTLVGIAAYLLLWATTWWTTRRGLAAARFDSPDRRATDDVVARGGVWGGINGLLVLAAGLAAIILPNIFDIGLDGLPVLVALLLVGAALALAVGALVGSLLALVDLGCWRLADWLVEPRAEE